ncbi:MULTISPECIES: hypothetical protein [unclassified Wolbachia]|nr:MULTISPECIES: hypothetical protein [unclassified Wolbachia]
MTGEGTSLTTVIPLLVSGIYAKGDTWITRNIGTGIAKSLQILVITCRI